MYPLRAERPAEVVITEIIPFSTNNWARKTVRFEIESVIFRNVEFPPSTFVNVIIGYNTITGIINYVPRQEQVLSTLDPLYLVIGILSLAGDQHSWIGRLHLDTPSLVPTLVHTHHLSVFRSLHVCEPRCGWLSESHDPNR